MMRDLQILGKGVSFPADTHVTGINGNTLVIGGTGSGKTMSIVEPALINTYDRSIIVTMTKRKLVKRYSGLLASRGYDIRILDFADPDRSTCSFDPLKYLRSESDVRQLATAIIKAESAVNKNIDPYWDNAAISLLTSLIAYVITEYEHPTFADVLDLYHAIETKDGDSVFLETNVDEKFKQLARKNPRHFALHGWNVFHNVSSRTASCIYSTLAAAMETVFNPELSRLMRMHQDVDFESIAKIPTAVFVVTSPFNTALNRFVSIFYSTAFSELFSFAEELESGTLPVPVHVFCDDLATGSPITCLDEYISIFREKGISIDLLLQSESQLQHMYGEQAATTIINNCDTYVYLGGMDLQSAKSISQRMNMPLEDVLYMPVGQVFICRRGIKPIKTVRYDTLSDEIYRSIVDEIG